MNYVAVLLPLALILLVCKKLAIFCKQVGLPQVIGFLVGGLLLGLIKLIPGQNIFNDASNEGLGFLAKIGVILIMFSAGIETDLKQIKTTGIRSFFITLAGVVVPFGLGFLLTFLFYKLAYGLPLSEVYKEALSYGSILTATSVSVTVATLKELGKLNSPMGTCIISSAILDDIIGVVILSIVLGLDGASSSNNAFLVNVFVDKLSMDASLASVLCIVLYFIIFICLGGIFAKGLGKLTVKYDHHRRIPIFSLAFCFALAWFAEEIFAVADITGAFLAGVLLSNNIDKSYIDRRTDIFSAFLFSPVFFANIGLNIEFAKMDPSFFVFGILFVVFGIIGKLVGCGLTAKMCKFSTKEACSIGIGMMVRAEVALVCADKLSSIVNAEIKVYVVLLILITSLVAPILLKLLNKDKTEVAAVTE